MARLGAALALLAAMNLLAQQAARAGHEVSYYPSFYPSEITLETLDPEGAASGLQSMKLQAYLGAAPRFTGNVPVFLKSAESLGAYVLLRFHPGAPGMAQPGQRCRAAEDVSAALAGAGGDFVSHPFPITPFDSDYLQHADRAQAALGRAKGRGQSAARWKIQARGTLGQHLIRAGWPVGEADPAITVEEVPVERLMAASGHVNGWLSPPWIKEGWFHAYQLLNPLLDAEAQGRVGPSYERLVRGDFSSQVERYNLERSLVAELMRPCSGVVAGYTMRREYFSDEHTNGVENIVIDSALGLNTPIFVRTVKLKDYPWNGPLHLGISQPAQAAWNPIAGFSDAPGRLMWAVIADDAFMLQPYNAGWIPNRIDPGMDVKSESGGKIPVPADAVVPGRGTGVLQTVGPGKTSSAVVVYKVLASPYLDDADMELADIIYPYSFAFRWAGQAAGARDPQVDAATALVRERLVGIRVINSERHVDVYADIKVPRSLYTIEVYLNHGRGDADQIAALAPPWSAVPWHLLALMEEAVQRGLAAFSEAEARRRNVPWLDLARNPPLQQRLRSLLATLEKERFVPAALAGGALQQPVTPEAAEMRWALLREFAETHGHLLVTNGPYVLKKWDDKSVSFEVVRDFRYAIGLGAFNTYATPSLARVTRVARDKSQVIVEAELQRMVQFQRDYRIVREPLRKGAARGFQPIVVQARSVLIDADGKVVEAAPPLWQEDGRFVLSLPRSLPEGGYTLAVGVYADGNAVNATVGTLRVEGSAR